MLQVRGDNASLETANVQEGDTPHHVGHLDPVHHLVTSQSYLFNDRSWTICKWRLPRHLLHGLARWPFNDILHWILVSIHLTYSMSRASHTSLSFDLHINAHMKWSDIKICIFSIHFQSMKSEDEKREEIYLWFRLLRRSTYGDATYRAKCIRRCISRRRKSFFIRYLKPFRASLCISRLF